MRSLSVNLLSSHRILILKLNPALTFVFESMDKSGFIELKVGFESKNVSIIEPCSVEWKKSDRLDGVLLECQRIQNLYWLLKRQKQ